ncbi:substrate-binding periplasmic protein [Aestuariibacter salexigens]|uniref:substrate-binding periplasmic protein n=1 Tax=Aestuariibacter salexigens TaxID=226010 RepID=UPI0006863048|nr:transporter substrate-binding domain-containing protein [Aestuariibacter salexigens]
MKPWTSLLLAVLLAVASAFVARAEPFEVAVGWTKPPYVIAADDTGFEIELITEILTRMGYKDVYILYVPYGRSVKMIQDGSVDMGLTLTTTHGIPEEMLSDAYVAYQNAVISLASASREIRALPEISHYSVAAFQNAHKVLGDIYRTAVHNAELYIELPEQRRQVEMLLMGSIDLAIMDRFIFMHLSEDITGIDQTDKVDIFQLFPTNYYQAGFKEPKILKRFNVELSRAHDDGLYRRLAEKYKLEEMATLVERHRVSH